MDGWNCIFIEKCEFLPRLLVNLNYCQGIILFTKRPNSDLQFTSDSGFSLENYNNIKMTDIFKRFFIW